MRVFSQCGPGCRGACHRARIRATVGSPGLRLLSREAFNHVQHANCHGRIDEDRKVFGPWPVVQANGMHQNRKANPAEQQIPHGVPFRLKETECEL
jgi:hypothetical protein